MPLTEEKLTRLQGVYSGANEETRQAILATLKQNGANALDIATIESGPMRPMGFGNSAIGREAESLMQGVVEGFTGISPGRQENVSKVDLPYLGETSPSRAIGTVAGGALSGGAGLLGKGILRQVGFVTAANAIDKVSRGEEVNAEDLAELAVLEMVGIGLDRFGAGTSGIRKKLDAMKQTAKARRIMQEVVQSDGYQDLRKVMQGAQLPSAQAVENAIPPSRLALPEGRPGAPIPSTQKAAPPPPGPTRQRARKAMQDLESFRIGRGPGRSVPPNAKTDQLSVTSGINASEQYRGTVPREVPPTIIPESRQLPAGTQPPSPARGQGNVRILPEKPLRDLGRGSQFIDQQGNAWEALDPSFKGKVRARNLQTGEVTMLSAFQNIRPFKLGEGTAQNVTNIDFLLGPKQ